MVGAGKRAQAVLSLLRSEGLPVGSDIMLHYYADKLKLDVKRGGDGNRSREYSEDDIARLRIFLMGKVLEEAAGKKNLFGDSAVNVSRRLRDAVMKEIRQGAE